MIATLDDAIAHLDHMRAIQLLNAADWRRTYGRIETGDHPVITLVYEKDGETPLRLDVHTRPVEGAKRDGDTSWVSITSCMDDAALPTLPRACATYQCEEIVRYRPRKRCTFRGRSEGRTAFIKVLADERGDQIAADALALQQHRDKLDFAIADCLGWNADLQAIAHASIPGRAVMPVMLAGGAVDLAAQIGDALGSLPRGGAEPTVSFTARDQIKRTSKYARKFTQAMPTLKPMIDAFVDALAQGHANTPDTPARTIHGSPHPHQWLEHEGRLALVDFDRLSLGPVEIDAATFIAELDFETDGMRAEAAAFLAAYEARVGGLDHRLLALYRAHKHFAKAFKYALAVDLAREQRAARILKAGLVQLTAGE